MDRTPEDEREHIEAIYLSHDAFAERTPVKRTPCRWERCSAQMECRSQRQSTRMLLAALRYSTNFFGPVTGRSLLHAKLIECLPMVTRDEEPWEKPVKSDGDDPYEAARYALKMRLRAKQPPLAECIEEKVEAAEFTDSTSEMI